MSKHAKPLFGLLSCVAVGSLALAATNPLERVQIYQHTTGTGFFKNTETTIITEHDQTDWGFDPHKSRLVASINHSYLFEKCAALIVSILASGAALPLAVRIMEDEKLDDLRRNGQKELAEMKLKGKFALARKSQQLMNQQELHELVSLVGGSEDQIVDEINATDKFLNCSYLQNEGHDIDKAVEMNWGVKAGTDEHTQLKSKYEEWLNDE
jgi:hypothetical protein